MVSEASPLLARPLPKTKPPLPRSRSRSLPALNAWAGRLSVFAWAVEFDTHGVFNAALDDRLFPPPYSRAGVRRFDRDVVHLRLQQPDLLEQDSSSTNHDIKAYQSVANSGVDDIICGHGEVRVAFCLVIGFEKEKKTHDDRRVLFTTTNSTRPQIRHLTRFVFSLANYL
jgi:hypothetical protein